MIEALDKDIGELVDHLKSEGLYSNTTIIVMGDNGTDGTAMLHLQEEYPHNDLQGLLQNGQLGVHPPGLYNLGATYDRLINYGAGPEGRFKASVYEKGIRVPLIVSGAGVLPALQGTTSDALVNVVDVYPTIQELWQVSPAAGAHVDGISFAVLLQDPDPPGLQEHARQYSLAEAFESNGDMHVASLGGDGFRWLGFSCVLEGDGWYKIVRTYKNDAPQTGTYTDEFYLLEDFAGSNSDPWEEFDLNSPPLRRGDMHYQQYRTLVNRLSPHEAIRYCEGEGAPGAPLVVLRQHGISSLKAPPHNPPNFELQVEGMLPNQLGMFFLGIQEGNPSSSTPFTGSGCIVGDQTRISIWSSDPSGNYSEGIDLLTLKHPSTLADFIPGETVKFQAWFHTANSTTPSGYSNALSIHLLP